MKPIYFTALAMWELMAAREKLTDKTSGSEKRRRQFDVEATRK